MAKNAALLRGINVGTAKAIVMAELAGVFAGLGYRDVATVLRSGNVVFRADEPLLAVATDGSKSFATFVTAMPTHLERPDAAFLAPEILVVGRAAIYQWMPKGGLATRRRPLLHRECRGW